MKQTVLILRGPAASGKTTLGEKLRNFDKKIAWLSIDVIKPIFTHYEYKSLDETNKMAVVLLEHLLNQGYSVVVDGIFIHPEHLQSLKEVAEKKDIPVVIYQLTCTLETLIKRHKDRGLLEGQTEEEAKIAVKSLYDKNVNRPIEGASELNTEKLSLEECLEIIQDNFEDNSNSY
jgi:predicted kinase